MPWPARSGPRPAATVGSGSRRRKTPLPGPTVAIEGLVAYAGTAPRLVTGLVTVGCDHTRILAPNVALLKGRQVTVVQEHGVAGAEDLLLQRGAYLASTEGIRCESRSEGLKGLFAQGLFVLRATGTGTIFGDAENLSTACSMSTRLCIVV